MRIGSQEFESAACDESASIIALQCHIMLLETCAHFRTCLIRYLFRESETLALLKLLHKFSVPDHYMRSGTDSESKS